MLNSSNLCQLLGVGQQVRKGGINNNHYRLMYIWVNKAKPLQQGFLGEEAMSKQVNK